jgi:NAD(P)-dependent dehydrogenase (short-subunit alcohol dehydrogenase family)
MMRERKKVLVTGASGTIGKSVIKTFLNNDWQVHATYLENKNFKAYSQHKNLILHCVDLSDKSSIDNLCENIDSSLNAIVNNAGINRPNDFNLISLEDWDKIFSVNVRGAFYLSQKFEKKIVDKGSIINIASFSGQVGGPRTTHYASSKAALISLTQNMARFFASREIRVNAVSPGVIESELAKAAKNLPILNDILLGRLGKAEEVADLIFFLCSEKSEYITAQTININGGLYF